MRRVATQKGFSILEVLLAGAIFVVFSWGVIEVLLLGLTFDRYSQEMTLATAYATEGLEAVRAIRKSGFDHLQVTESSGIIAEDGTLRLGGEENRFDDKYVRTIAVRTVERGDDGSIVVSGGTVDEDTMRVTVTVTWSRGVDPNEPIVLETYLTRWQ